MTFHHWNTNSCFNFQFFPFINCGASEKWFQWCILVLSFKNGLEGILKTLVFGFLAAGLVSSSVLFRGISVSHFFYWLFLDFCLTTHSLLLLAQSKVFSAKKILSWLLSSANFAVNTLVFLCRRAERNSFAEGHFEKKSFFPVSNTSLFSISLFLFSHHLPINLSEVWINTTTSSKCNFSQFPVWRKIFLGDFSTKNFVFQFFQKGKKYRFASHPFCKLRKADKLAIVDGRPCGCVVRSENFRQHFFLLAFTKKCKKN